MTERDEQHPIAVAALQRKRAEIAGAIEQIEKTLVERRNDLAAVDRALLLMNSPLPGESIPPVKPRPSNKGFFTHGEIGRRIYAALRNRDDVSAAELADMTMAAKGLEDLNIRATFLSRFLVRLSSMAKAGNIERIGSGQGVRWRAKSD